MRLVLRLLLKKGSNRYQLKSLKSFFHGTRGRTVLYYLNIERNEQMHEYAG